MAQPPLRTERPFAQVQTLKTTAVNGIRPVAVASRDARAGQAEATISVGIADEQILVRGGIRAMLERADDLRVVGEAVDGGGAVALAMRLQPRVMLIDGVMAGAGKAQVIRTLRRLAPMTAVVVLASSTDMRHVDRVVRAGVSGCLLKNGNPQGIVAAVRVAATGGAALCPEVAKHVLKRAAQVDTDRVERARERIGDLTLREREVLALVGQGMANSEIGRALHLSEGGVKAHISRLLTKLGCGNRVRAALVAHDAGITGDPA